MADAPAGSHWLVLVRSDRVPVEDGWLSDREREVLSGLRVPPRRASWRLGRWAAKTALAESLGLPRDPANLARLEVLAAEDGAPEGFREGAILGRPLSLSHSGELGLAVVGEPGEELGCDLERIEPRDESFVADFFTPGEVAALDGLEGEARDVLVTAMWSAKECALKALRCGLRRDTRDAEVDGALASEELGEDWCPVTVRVAAPAKTFTGWVRAVDGVIQALLSSPGRSRPPTSPAGPGAGSP